mgnify:CR=1 FL=1
MSICRHLDEVAFKLQRSGRMGTYPQNKGQEACAIGSGMAAVKGRDFLCPCYRENAALFMHGLPMHYVLLHWMGDERGNQIPPGVNVTPISIPIGPTARVSVVDARDIASVAVAALTEPGHAGQTDRKSVV